MSRREEEFKHRTSIFEGAYRAWSHLGGIDIDVLFESLVKDLDPVQHPLVNDVRIKKNSNSNANDDGSVQKEYPYEPLPRCGLTHPYVQAILSPWLGPHADHDAVELGLATLRTWWQHRRKGENKSAIKILGTPKMRLVIDKYTKHFFELAHCLITNDSVQAPRTLHMKLKQSDQTKYKYQTGVKNDDDMSIPHQEPVVTELAHLTPLERMHMVQKNASMELQQQSVNTNVIPIKGKCIPGMIDLPGIVDAVKRHANNLAHRGASIGSSGSKDINGSDSNNIDTENDETLLLYGDPKTTPLIFANNRDEYSIVLKVDGITCAHCVKIVETVLKGCSGTIGRSPISGLLDAAADHGVSSVIIRIENPFHAKRIAYESKRNLSLVGYTAQSIDVQLLAPTSDASSTLPDGQQQERCDILQKSVIDIAKANRINFFDFHAPCTCPDSGVYRNNCPRHSQMDDDMFHMLSGHEQRVNEYIESKRSGMRGNDLEGNFKSRNNNTAEDTRMHFGEPIDGGGLYTSQEPPVTRTTFGETATKVDIGVGACDDGTSGGMINDNLLRVDQTMQFVRHDVAPDGSMIDSFAAVDVEPLPYYNSHEREHLTVHQPHHTVQNIGLKHVPTSQGIDQNQQQQRHSFALNHNPRSSVSALSIDWEVYELLNEFAANDGEEEMTGDDGLIIDYNATNFDIPHQKLQQHQGLQPPEYQRQQQYHVNKQDDMFQI